MHATPSSRAETEHTIDISSMDSSYAVTMSLMQMIADAYESAERRSKNLARGNGKEGEGAGCSNLRPTSVRPEPGQEKVVQWLVSRRFLPPNYLPDRDLEKYYPPPSSTETAADNIINAVRRRSRRSSLARSIMSALSSPLGRFGKNSWANKYSGSINSRLSTSSPGIYNERSRTNSTYSAPTALEFRPFIRRRRFPTYYGHRACTNEEETASTMTDSSAALALRSRSPRAMASPGTSTSLLSINLPIYKVPRPSEAKPTLTEAVGCHVASATEKGSDPVSTPEREITSLATERKVSDLTFFVVLFSFVCLVFSCLFLYFLYVAFSKLFPSVLYEEESDYIGYNDYPSAMHADYDGYDDHDRDLV